MKRKQPAIILTSKFVAPIQTKIAKIYGRYVGYMTRKEALESKEYLTDDEKNELKNLKHDLRQLDVESKFQIAFKKTFINEDDSSATTEAKKVLNHKYMNELNDEQFGKYLGYMYRIDALAKTKEENGSLTEKENQELNRVTKAAGKLSELHATKNKIAIGAFTSDLDIVRLDDFQHIRDKLNEGQQNKSVMWQDVISFDNDFLIRKGILNKETGHLDENAMRRASKKMMEVFQSQMDPPLYEPYWVASIHRNTDNVHIHFATVEKENHRKLIERTDDHNNYVEQPKGRRPLHVIDRMKSTFANELIQTQDLIKVISKERDQIKEDVKVEFEKRKELPNFQRELNDFLKHLPADRRKWNYKWLEKNDQDAKEKLDHITDHLLEDYQDYDDWKKHIGAFQLDRQQLYGISKRDNKDYKENKLKDIRRRNGNTLLHKVAEMDKLANHYRQKIPLKNRTNPDKYIQEVLKEVKKGGHHSPPPTVKNHKSSNHSRKPSLAVINAQQMKKLEHKLKHQTRKSLEYDKDFVDRNKRKALNAHERIEEAVKQKLAEDAELDS